MNRLILIDGNAILHRAYHALPPLTAPDGSVINALYGFTSMLFKLFSDVKPTHIAVAFDRAAPTFRKKKYKQYQATRPKLDDDLASQIPKIHQMVEAFGISIFEMDGYEADDVIGTLCQKATSDKKQETRNQIDQVIIVTGDRDLLQLVDGEKVLVYMPTKGISEGKLYGEKEVVERMGVTPKQIPDYKALAGDASDNYPGVEGIGPKTASNLLVAYKTLETLYKALEVKTSDIRDTVREKLLSGRESSSLFQEIATIRKDVPLVGPLPSLAVSSLDTPKVRQLLTEYGFHTLLRRLIPDDPDRPPKKTKKKGELGEQLSLV